ncbi:MFS transporter [Nocardioides jejuensis]|uniref:MFS transporter n=1 Tax=Nocardioides jejuensis TaxID=2502782 RepID=A0A4R1CJS8_9ACTN|nr:MFS transporter [Nocardioides jejuensis]TCJ30635.1 MFS transporter [Nocardioides jejuensis]
MDHITDRRSWLTIVAFAALGAVTQLLWLTYAPVTSASAEHYGVSETAIGWLANVFPLWYVLLAIPAGLSLDRWMRPTLIVGAALTALGGIARVLSDDYAAALVGQTLVAIAQPLVLTAMTPMAARYLAERDRAKGIAFASAATFAGMIVAFLLATMADLTAVLHLDAIIGVLAGGAVLLALRQAPRFASSGPSGGLSDFLAAWRNPAVRRMCLLVPVPFGTFTALTTWGQPLLEPAGVTADQAGILLLINVVAGVIGCAAVPVWAAQNNRQGRTLIAGIAATTIACVLLAVAPSMSVALACFVVVGALLLPALPIVLEISERAAGDAAGAAAGLVWLAGQLGALVVTGVTGVLVDAPTWAFLLLAVVTIGALPAVPRTRSAAVVTADSI